MVALRYEETSVDSDGDGVPDSRDKCPTEKEDLDGNLDDDGCLDPDNDGDGVVDGEDGCPDKPGPKELKGCPADMDTDGDGIFDHLDACPQKPGPQEYDGCPDTDGDEVPDNEDECPDMFGPPENNGCPYEAPPFVLVESDRIRIKGNILFETGKANIRRQSFKLLDEVASVLARNPTLGPVLIEGHTDNVGTRALNLDLSNRRAKAVLEYLVNKGIDRKRLRSQGFGFDRPITSNKTPLGRAKNRRVEFRLIKNEVETPPRDVPSPLDPAKSGGAAAAPQDSAPASDAPSAPAQAQAQGTASSQGAAPAQETPPASAPSQAQGAPAAPAPAAATASAPASAKPQEAAPAVAPAAAKETPPAKSPASAKKKKKRASQKSR
jgi:outer membrane protein OmpA-like peptidoglycan-associated protein